MRKSYISFVVLLSGCSLYVNPLESVSPPLEVPAAPASLSPSSSVTAKVEPTQNLAKLDRAQEFYLWAAQEGYPQAQKIYGEWLLNQGQAEEGIQWLEKAAQKGCEAADIVLAKYMAETDPNKSIAYMTPLIEKKYVPALLLAADLRWRQGQEDSAILYLESAAHSGDLRAQSLLAERISAKQSQPWSQVSHLTSGFDKQLFPEADDPLSSIAITAGRTDNNVVAQMAIDEWMSPEEFIDLYMNATDLGSPYAAFQQLTLRLRYPTLMPRLNISFEELAALASDIPPGAVLQARLILKKQISGTYEKAWSHLEQAAMEKEPYALFACSMRARHLKKFPEALKLYQEGLAQPNFSSALIQAAQDLIDGHLGFFDDQAGFDGLFYLAQSGNPHAMLCLADYKLKGKIRGTAEEAFLLRYQAAWKDLPSAQYLLANMYLTGQGVAQSDEKAFRWFYQSARQGYRPAQYQLSKMYQHGQGILPELVEAYAWRSISMRGLHEDPQYQVSTLASNMTWDQLEQAVSRAESYKKVYTHSGLD